ncbi:MAG: lysophospholipid acyltransferase family protein [Brumimicrobium sp.]
MLGAAAYYILVYPLSLLPLWVLYRFSDFFYLLLITIIPYRKKIILKNLRRSFPEKSEKEIQKIKRDFYRHLSDLLAESTKNLSLSKEKLQKRFVVENKEIIDQLYQNKKSVLLVSGHYNNWEWLISAQNLIFSHQAVGVGMPLTNGFWNKKLNTKRARFGMEIIHSANVYDFFDNNQKVIATLVLADQSPGDSKKSYWTNFLNQKSGFVFGPELLANKYDHAVVYFEIIKEKRGYYRMRLKEITTEPRETEYGEIILKFTELLEETIQKAPEYWLWSHNRWKRDIPNNLDVLHDKHKLEFEKRFRN